MEPVERVKNLGGRPYTIDWNDIADRLEKYVEETEQPFLQEFCLIEDVSRANFYEQMNRFQRLADVHKKLLDKQELYILKNAPTGKYNPVFAIFRLKQPSFGYTDKSESIHTIEVTAVPAEERRTKIEELKQRLLEG